MYIDINNNDYFIFIGVFDLYFEVYIAYLESNKCRVEVKNIYFEVCKTYVEVD